VLHADGAVRPVLLPPHASGLRAFDDSLGNKDDKLDLEAGVTLPDGRFVAFGSGSTAAREQLVVWDGREPPWLVAAQSLYAELRSAVTRDGARLNVEGAVVRGARLEILHRGNDVRDATSAPNAIVELACEELAAWLDRSSSTPPPSVARVTTVELGAVHGVPFGFTDAVAVDEERTIVLACAEDSAGAIADGAVLGCRAGMLAAGSLRMVDIYDRKGGPTQVKLEGIERRVGSRTEFDVAADADEHAAPAQFGRLVWKWH
jgi:hypothetical protein